MYFESNGYSGPSSSWEKEEDAVEFFNKCRDIIEDDYFEMDEFLADNFRKMMITIIWLRILNMEKERRHDDFDIRKILSSSKNMKKYGMISEDIDDNYFNKKLVDYIFQKFDEPVIDFCGKSPATAVYSEINILKYDSEIAFTLEDFKYLAWDLKFNILIMIYSDDDYHMNLTPILWHEFTTLTVLIVAFPVPGTNKCVFKFDVVDYICEFLYCM